MIDESTPQTSMNNQDSPESFVLSNPKKGKILEIYFSTSVLLVLGYVLLFLKPNLDFGWNPFIGFTVFVFVICYIMSVMRRWPILVAVFSVIFIPIFTYWFLGMPPLSFLALQVEKILLIVCFCLVATAYFLGFLYSHFLSNQSLRRFVLVFLSLLLVVEFGFAFFIGIERHFEIVKYTAIVAAENEIRGSLKSILFSQTLSSKEKIMMLGQLYKECEQLDVDEKRTASCDLNVYATKFQVGVFNKSIDRDVSVPQLVCEDVHAQYMSKYPELHSRNYAGGVSFEKDQCLSALKI